MAKKTLKMISGAMCAVTGLFCACDASAETLTWNGTNKVWDTTNINWNDENGNPCKYVNGSDVIFPAFEGVASTNVTGGYANLIAGSVTFNPTTRYVFDLDNNHKPLTFGTITFMNGTSFNSHGSKTSWTKLNGEVIVKRLPDGSSAPSVSFGSGMVCYTGDGAPIVFNVEEVTSEDGSDDEVADLNQSGRISDPTIKDTGLSHRTSWDKRGPGRMNLNYVRNECSGNINIYEGMVYTTGSHVGRLDVEDRCIVVHRDAVLAYDGNGVPSNYNQPIPMMTTIVSNGLLNANYAKSTNSGFFVFGNLVLVGDASIRFNGGFWQHVGAVYQFGRLTSFELNNPIVFAHDTGGGFLISNCVDTRTEVVEVIENDVVKQVTHTYGFSEFRVKPAKNDPRILHDVTIPRGMKDGKNSSNMHCGVRKSGDGILVMKGTNGYTYQTEVKEGGLYLEGSVNNDVSVSSGAAFGGKGTVKGDLTVAGGGGLVVDATNVTARATVEGSFALPNDGFLYVANYTAPLNEVSTVLTGIPLPNNAGYDYSSLDVSDWRVKLKGYEKIDYKNLRVKKEADNTLTVYSPNLGLKIILR